MLSILSLLRVSVLVVLELGLAPGCHHERTQPPEPPCRAWYFPVLGECIGGFDVSDEPDPLLVRVHFTYRWIVQADEPEPEPARWQWSIHRDQLDALRATARERVPCELVIPIDPGTPAQCKPTLHRPRAVEYPWAVAEREESGCDLGIANACRDLAVRARDADPPDPNVAARFARACAVMAVMDGHDACEQNRPADLAIGCAAYLPVRVPVDHRTHLPPLGAANARPALLFSAHGVSPTTYAEVARRLADAAAVYVYADTGTDPAPYAPAVPISLDAALATVRVTSGPVSMGSALATTLGEQWPLVVDATGTPRAVLSFQHGLVPATLARCVRGLLAEP